ncbi:MAG: LysM peptidoglycan-binding domain-containing protein [Rheinheimera sp.]|nr:LysM peptidoglycan-binding domain-containing protein [Rheinheimera sp.]
MVAYQLDDKTEQQAAEKFMLSVYPTSPETAWMLSADFSASEPEKLRLQYKASLLGVDPTVLTAAPASSPKIKIVKRKTGVEPESQAYGLTTDRSLPRMETTATEPAVTPEPALTPQPAVTPPVLPTQAKATTDPAMRPGNEPATAAVTTKPVPSQSGTHKVLYGETLFRIASKYRLSVSELQRLNQLTDPADLRAGQVLKLSEASALPREYQVQDGDTLFSIAYKFNLALAQLAAWNQLATDAVLSNGQTILLHDPVESAL